MFTGLFIYSRHRINNNTLLGEKNQYCI